MESVRFRLLGPVAMFKEGAETAIGHPKQRCVLAALLVNVNQSVHTSVLIDQVWGEAPPPTVRSALYTYIAQLRSVLSPFGVPLLKKSNGYVIEADPDSIDLHRFRRLAGYAARCGDACAAAALTEAVSLWTGPPFGGLSTPWLDAMRAAVLAEYRAVVLRRNQILLTLGQHAELLPELLRATADAPLDESLAAQLITALNESGQRASALEHYHHVRDVLATELGIDPSTSLQNVYHRILGSVTDRTPRKVAAARTPR
ncbi:BTAD domain-containing putative transcriptional regulator [Streptomyces sp. NPDC020096]